MKIMLIIPVILLTFFIGCKGKETKAIETIPNVKSIVVKDTTIPVVVDVVGKIIPKSSVTVFSQIPGKVEKIFVQEGDTVYINQTLANVIQEIPGSEYKPYSVKSPIKGIVLKSMVDVGRTINPQTPLFEIGDVGCLNFKGQVFGEERFVVKVGQRIAITNDQKDTLAVVKINFISPQVDPVTGGVTVETQVCRLSPKNAHLIINQTMNGHIIVSTRQGKIIPRKSVVNLSDKGTGVFKIENDKAVFVPIQIISRSEEYFLVSGLNENDLIVRDGAEKLNDGQQIRLIKE
ncbi:MAG: efflux RND transporter periplasmic adaptor subunit [candidate division WOR-3 bacterium]|nr:efflux RND transporter periplasmic adaptor subunit [candidate division WOR-3 bacterium]